ncbi:MFS transporter [Brevibacillus laterosporus]|uniref:Inner membrane protein YbjJ n=1 Tax=Brevibacillus laterosporus LMG 15441 TaxID=1042163 RepID=A0A075R7C1_BRELA|nr:MFS transporter [Brevibacillus laterosporus]AIG27311.1 inner membrane protein YbjJ [Brevibacillus laterosporus LMG 15441]RJL11497.1 MFS transporter [Brevibacillus laterosporus]TPH09315.1 MFS transporter [Brevibacillus laterosporus]
MTSTYNQNPRIVRNILFLLFALPGISFASWVSRTPAVRDLLQLSTAEMGIIIFALAAGSLLGLLTTGSVIARKGACLVIMVSSLLIVIGFAAIGVGTALTSVPVVMGGLLIFGCGYGSAEVALNVEGSAVEKVLNRTLLPAFHGFFIVGTLVGAAISAGALALHLPILVHFLILALLMAAAVYYCYRYLPENTGKEQMEVGTPKHSAVKQQLKVWNEKRTLLIGIIVLGMAFAEGSANDWLPLVMVNGYGVNALTGSFVYDLFVAAMTMGRLTGGKFLDRFGRERVLLGCSIAATIGLLLVIWGQHYLVASVGVVLWGLGASLGFPVGLSAAGDEPQGAAARVGAVATTGYIAFLVGPPVLGFLGEHFGLLRALIAVFIGIIIAGSLSRAARPLQNQNITKS